MGTVLRVILTGDELSELEGMRHVLSEYPNVIVAGMYTAREKALAAMENDRPDAVFIDIGMPAENGLELAEEMAGKYPEVKVVFVSAYNQYAIEAFDASAVDFLRKRLRKEQLGKTLIRLEKSRESRHSVPEAYRPIKIQCFRKFMVYTPSGAPLSFRTRKTEELMALLLHSGQREVPRGKIIDLMWPELDEKRAVALFHTTLYNLKKALGELNGGMELMKTRGGYSLCMRDTIVDVEDLEQRLHRFRRLGDGDMAELEQVLKLYTGAYYGDDAYPWAEGKRLYLQNAVTEMLMDIGLFYQQKALWANAAYAFENLLRIDDMHEAAYEMLVRCLRKAGDTGRMQKVYGSYLTALQELNLPIKLLGEICIE